MHLQPSKMNHAVKLLLRKELVHGLRNQLRAGGVQKPRLRVAHVHLEEWDLRRCGEAQMKIGTNMGF